MNRPQNISVTGLTLITNATPNARGHKTVARFDAAIPGVELRGCSLCVSGNTGGPFWAATAPSRWVSARVTDNDIWTEVLRKALSAYAALGGEACGG